MVNKDTAKPLSHNCLVETTVVGVKDNTLKF